MIKILMRLISVLITQSVTAPPAPDHVHGSAHVPAAAMLVLSSAAPAAFPPTSDHSSALSMPPALVPDSAPLAPAVSSDVQQPASTVVTVSRNNIHNPASLLMVLFCTTLIIADFLLHLHHFGLLLLMINGVLPWKRNFLPCKLMAPGLLFPSHPVRTSLVVNGFFVSKNILMALLISSKLALLHAGLLSSMALIILRLLVRLSSRLQQYVLCFLLLCLGDGMLARLTSTMHSFMVF
jgi:hypothetical protein